MERSRYRLRWGSRWWWSRTGFACTRGDGERKYRLKFFVPWPTKKAFVCTGVTPDHGRRWHLCLWVHCLHYWRGGRHRSVSTDQAFHFSCPNLNHDIAAKLIKMTLCLDIIKHILNGTKITCSPLTKYSKEWSSLYSFHHVSNILFLTKWKSSYIYIY